VCGRVACAALPSGEGAKEGLCRARGQRQIRAPRTGAVVSAKVGRNPAFCRGAASK
jgi:hypothetical protein